MRLRLERVREEGGGDFGCQGFDLHLRRAGIDRHFDALLLCLGELEAEIGVLSREFQQSEAEG